MLIRVLSRLSKSSSFPRIEYNAKLLQPEPELHSISSVEQFLSYLGGVRTRNCGYSPEIYYTAAQILRFGLRRELILHMEIQSLLELRGIEAMNSRQLVYAFDLVSKLLFSPKLESMIDSNRVMGGRLFLRDHLERKLSQLKVRLDRACDQDQVETPFLIKYIAGLGYMGQQSNSVLDSLAKRFQVPQEKANFDARNVSTLVKAIVNSSDKSTKHYDFVYRVVSRLSLQDFATSLELSHLIITFECLARLQLHRNTSHKKSPLLLQNMADHIEGKIQELNGEALLISVFKAFHFLPLIFDNKLLIRLTDKLHQDLKFKRLIPSLRFLSNLMHYFPTSKLRSISELVALINRLLLDKLERESKNYKIIAQVAQKTDSFFYPQMRAPVFQMILKILVQNRKEEIEATNSKLLVQAQIMSILSQHLGEAKDLARQLYSKGIDGTFLMKFYGLATLVNLNLSSDLALKKLLKELREMQGTTLKYEVAYQFGSLFHSISKRQFGQIHIQLKEIIEPIATSIPFNKLVRLGFVLVGGHFKQTWSSFFVKACAKAHTEVIVNEFKKLQRNRRTRDINHFICKLLQEKKMHDGCVIKFLKETSAGLLTNEANNQVFQELRELNQSWMAADKATFQKQSSVTDLLVISRTFHVLKLNYLWLVQLALRKENCDTFQTLEMLELAVYSAYISSLLGSEEIGRKLLSIVESCQKFLAESEEVSIYHPKVIKCFLKLSRLGVDRVDLVFLEGQLGKAWAQLKSSQELILQLLLAKRSGRLKVSWSEQELMQALRESILNHNYSIAMHRVRRVKELIEELQPSQKVALHTQIAPLVVQFYKDYQLGEYHYNAINYTLEFLSLVKTEYSKKALLEVVDLLARSVAKDRRCRVSDVCSIIKKFFASGAVECFSSLQDAVALRIERQPVHFMKYLPETILFMGMDNGERNRDKVAVLMEYIENNYKEKRVEEAIGHALKREQWLLKGLLGLNLRERALFRLAAIKFSKNCSLKQSLSPLEKSLKEQLQGQGGEGF